MWHVDEGALHAYLDGALDEYPAPEARRVREHLEACGHCADRLAEERRLRDEAQDILALASPRVEIPTLEELRAYVKAQAPERTKASVRLYRLSWAASVVLALGTGWMLRGGVPETPPTAERDVAAGTAAARAPSQPGEASEAPRLEAQNETVLPLLDGSTSDAASPAPGATAGPSAPSGSTPPAASVRIVQEDAPSARSATDTRREAAERSVSSTPTAAADEDRVQGPAGADEVASTADADAAGAAGARAPRPEPAPTPELAATNEALRDQASREDAVARRVAEPRLQSAIGQAPTPGLGAGAPLAGRAADAPADAVAEAGAETEPVSLVVPGLEVLDVLRIGEETTFLGMRALQLLPSGDTLETAHLPQGVDPTSLPPLRPGWSELSQQHGSGWLVMRAPIPPAALAELLRRLEEGR